MYLSNFRFRLGLLGIYSRHLSYTRRHYDSEDSYSLYEWTDGEWEAAFRAPQS